MRVHINLDEPIVAEIDRRVPRGKRSAYIEEAVVRTLRDQRRWESIVAAIGSIPAEGHDWDADSVTWVRAQRSTDRARIG